MDEYENLKGSLNVYKLRHSKDLLFVYSVLSQVLQTARQTEIH